MEGCYQRGDWDGFIKEYEASPDPKTRLWEASVYSLCIGLTRGYGQFSLTRSLLYEETPESMWNTIRTLITLPGEPPVLGLQVQTFDLGFLFKKNHPQACDWFVAHLIRHKANGLALICGSRDVNLFLRRKRAESDDAGFRICANCLYVAPREKLKACSSCRLFHYCSEKCQHRHWENAHKVVCKKASQFILNEVSKLENLTKAASMLDKYIQRPQWVNPALYVYCLVKVGQYDKAVYMFEALKPTGSMVMEAYTFALLFTAPFEVYRKARTEFIESLNEKQRRGLPDRNNAQDVVVVAKALGPSAFIYVCCQMQHPGLAVYYFKQNPGLELGDVNDIPPVADRFCAHCLRVCPEVKLCSKCKAFYYCSDECVQADWAPRHRQVCRERDCLSYLKITNRDDELK